MNSQTGTCKRYACDRCRDQKLRCPRTPPGDSTCERCLRVGAICVTSSGRPIGRPPMNANNPSHGNAGSSQTPQARRERKQEYRGPTTISTTSNPLPSPPSYPSSTISVSGTNGVAARPLSHSPTNLNFTPANLNTPANFNAMFDMHLDGSEFRQNNESSFADFHLENSTFPSQFRPHSTNMPDLNCQDMGGDMGEQPTNSLYIPPAGIDDDDFRRSESSEPEASANSDSSRCLIGVIGNISRQVADLKNQSSESWNPHLIKIALFDRYDRDWTRRDPIAPNSWEDILYVTTRFVAVLQTMVPIHFSKAPAPSSPPNLSTTLMLLSTYIQLGELFNSVLARIFNCLQDTPRHSNSELDSQIASASTQQRTLATHPSRHYIMMMIQVFEHQLHSMECVMGLPADCRLWSQEDAYAGILGQEESSVLTQAVMGQAQDTFRSLKRTIDRIQNSLRDHSHALQNSSRYLENVG